jgi:hypothetical protein
MVGVDIFLFLIVCMALGLFFQRGRNRPTPLYLEDPPRKKFLKTIEMLNDYYNLATKAISFIKRCVFNVTPNIFMPTESNYQKSVLSWIHKYKLYVIDSCDVEGQFRGRVLIWHPEYKLILLVANPEPSAIKDVMNIPPFTYSFHFLFRFKVDKDEFFKEIKSELDSCLGIWKNNHDYWKYAGQLKPLGFNNLYLDPSVEKQITGTIDGFIQNKETFLNNNVPYVLRILLKGPPGTGKSSILTAICNKYKMQLGYLKLPSSSDSDSFKHTPENCLYVLEDLDRSYFDEIDGRGKSSAMSVSALLNNLDGQAMKENTIIIATANFPERLPGALLSRFHIIEVPLPNRESYLNAWMHVYKTVCPNSVVDELIKHKVSFRHLISFMLSRNESQALADIKVLISMITDETVLDSSVESKYENMAKSFKSLFDKGSDTTKDGD